MAEEQDAKSLEVRITRLENAITKLAEGTKPADLSAEEIKAYLKVGSVLGRGGLLCGPGFTSTLCGPGFTSIANPAFYYNPFLNPLHGGTSPLVCQGPLFGAVAGKFEDLGSK
jgi:hypothetical protein